MVSAEEPSRKRLDKCFSRGAIKPPANARTPSSPKLMTSSWYCGTPPTRLASVLLLPLLSHQLMALKRKDTSACPLWMSPWLRISARPRLMDGRRGRAIRPSCASALAGCAYSAAGQAASALHSTAVLQVFQAKMLTIEEAGLDAASLRDLRSATNLALRTTKATAQAIGHSLSSLVVLECHDGGDVRGGQSSLPRRSGFVRQPVWTSCLDFAGPESFLLKLAILWVHLTNIFQASPSLGLSIQYGRQVSTLWDDNPGHGWPYGSACARCILWTPLALTPTWVLGLSRSTS